MEDKWGRLAIGALAALCSLALRIAELIADMRGVVAGIDEEGSKPVVLVDIFGRDTPVEMAATDVVKP